MVFGNQPHTYQMDGLCFITEHHDSANPCNVGIDDLHLQSL